VAYTVLYNTSISAVDVTAEVVRGIEEAIGRPFCNSGNWMI
jgi:hypothetical protein